MVQKQSYVYLSTNLLVDDMLMIFSRYNLTSTIIDKKQVPEKEFVLVYYILVSSVPFSFKFFC